MHTLTHHLIQYSAQATPEATALLFKSARLSYKELSQHVATMAHGFIQQGILRSERIATFLTKQFESVISLFACSAAGACFVPVNPVLKPEQLLHILNDCNVKILVTNAARLKQLQPHLHQCSDLHTIILVDKQQNPTNIHPGHIQILFWQDLITTPQTHYPQIPNIDTDIAAIFYTSGSTGRPKGVVISHKNFITGAHSVVSYLNNTSNDRLLAILPLSFDYGFSQLTTAFSVGASIVLMDYLLPQDIIKAISHYAITGLAAVPAVWIQLARLDWPESSLQLRYYTNSGGALPLQTLNTLMSKLPHSKPYLMYGLTEAFRSTYVPPESLKGHELSIGIAIPNVEIKVLREDGSECADNEPGELVHRGSLVSLGYWNAPAKTSKHFRAISVQPGQLATELAVWSGDTVKRDKDGFLYFLGRKDDMIKTSGYRVSPNEIEEVVYQSEMVAEAVATGVPHPELGQAIIVFVVSDSSSFQTSDLLNYCKKHLPNFMQPAKIIRLDQIPRNQNDKIDRKFLAENYKALCTPEI